MPYRFETLKLKVGRERSRKIKLTDEQRDEIRSLYGKISQRKLAKMFGVSRSTIIFIGCPERYKKSKLRRKLAGQKYYYKEKHLIYMKRHRDYKKLLFPNETKIIQ